MNELKDWLPYLLPPILGAVIGYVTNFIAIRMLFRPLRPWRVLGLRVPLTPGIIPAKRGELARRMGEMVGRHLLTADDVSRVLAREDFQKELRGEVRGKFGGFLDRDLGPAASLVPAAYSERFRDLMAAVRRTVGQAVFRYLDSAGFEARLRNFLQEKEDRLLARDLESFLDHDRYGRVRDHLRERSDSALHSEPARRAVAGFLEQKTEQWLNSERPLRELLPRDLVEVILQQLEKEVPPLLEKFGGLLYDPDFRSRLVARGKVAIEGFLDSLEGLSGLLAGFINLDKIYARLPDFLDQAGDEISRWLRRESTQQEVAAMIRERLDGLLDRPLNSYLEKVPYEKVAGMQRFLRDRTIEVMHSPRSAETLMAWTEKGMDRIKDRSFRSLLGQVLPEGGIERSREALADRLIEFIRSPEARDAWDRVFAEQVERWVFRLPLGKLSARIPVDAREELEGFLFCQLDEVLKKEVPPLVETLNIARMVEEKVNGLDLLEVEGLLMGIMKEQFKYINLFGGLLGFLIGLLNLLLLWPR